MLKHFSLFACLGLLLLAFSATTFAADAQPKAPADASLDNVKKENKLVVAFCAAYPPFESRNEKSGEFEGFDIDLAKALAKKLGVEVELRDTEWPGLIAGLNKGDFDVIISCMSKSETRGQNVSMSEVYYSLYDVVVVRKGDEAIKTAADLQGKIVGVQLGSSAEQAVDSLKDLGEVRRYNYNPEAFLDLQNKRIDALVVGEAYAVVQMRSMKDTFHVVGPVGEAAEVVMVLRKESGALTAALNAALSELRTDGGYQAILDTWLKAE